MGGAGKEEEEGMTRAWSPSSHTRTHAHTRAHSHFHWIERERLHFLIHWKSEMKRKEPWGRWMTEPGWGLKPSIWGKTVEDLTTMSQPYRALSLPVYLLSMLLCSGHSKRKCKKAGVLSVKITYLLFAWNTLHMNICMNMSEYECMSLVKCY